MSVDGNLLAAGMLDPTTETTAQTNWKEKEKRQEGLMINIHTRSLVKINYLYLSTQIALIV